MMQRRVQKELRFSGLSARPDAVRLLVQVMQDTPEADEVLPEVVRHLKGRVKAGSALDVASVQAVLEELGRDDEDLALRGVQFVDALSMPCFRYNQSRKQFYRVSGQGTVMPRQHFAVFRDRYVLLHQRLLRNPLFAPPLAGLGGALNPVPGASRQQRRVAAPNIGGGKHCELTQVESLMASRGDKCVLGLISRLSDGQLYLEDLNGRIPVDLSEASFGRGLMTEGCIVLAEGRLHDGVFRPFNIASPPAEPRQETNTAHGNMDFVSGKPALSAEALDDLLGHEKRSANTAFVIASEVHLDSPEVRANLRSLFGGCVQMSEPPALFVFMGEFSARPFGEFEGQCSSKEFAEHFAALGSILADFPVLLRDSQFVFLPGPRDPGGPNILPRTPLPKAFQRPFMAAVRSVEPNVRVTFASNPCRIQFFSKEIVLFREDLLGKVRRHCLHEPTADEPAEKHLCRTIVEQAHLCPLPTTIAPILYAHDSALRLYPLPHAIFTGDSYDQFECEHAGTAMANPGSFALDASFIMYLPATGDVQFSRVPSPDDTGDGGMDEST